MQRYLVFWLYGFLSSWGDIAVGEYRPTHDHPTKSAVFGILAAAFGIKRSEETRLKELARGLGFSVCVHQSGLLLRDYHTVQVPGQDRKRIYYTRKEELSNEDLKSIVSTRDYRSDALYTVALWEKNESSFSLEKIKKALKKPVFTLYLGRKSCPPSLPLEPKIIGANTLADAFLSANMKASQFLLPSDSFRMIYWEEHPDPGFKEAHIISRRDELYHRGRWQFTERLEHYAPVKEAGDE